jgi:phosphoribosylformylglycinamidine synthase PurS subunit
MAKVVVDVMLKPEILDPQGRAVKGALTRLGLGGVVDVRQGKRFEIDLSGDLDLERLEQVHRLAEELLANPVIEDYDLRITDEGGVQE